MWANADDQGRLCGDPEEIKYAVCPNIDHITKQDIPFLLKELQDNKLILCYDTPKSAAIQMLDWWDANQKMQWAWPSEYSPPEGWQDHLRYKKDAKTVCRLNWPVSGESSGEDNIVAQVSEVESSGESSGETTEISPLTTPSPKTKKITRRGRGRGNSPERSGEEAPKGACKKQADPVVNEIFTEMRTYLGYPDRVKKDPIPSYGKEGQAIKRMLARGFTREEVTGCWKQKVDARGGEFVSMTWVNEDIGKKGDKAREQGKGQRVKVHSREAFRGGKW